MTTGGLAGLVQQTTELPENHAVHHSQSTRLTMYHVVAYPCRACSKRINVTIWARTQVVCIDRSLRLCVLLCPVHCRYGPARQQLMSLDVARELLKGSSKVSWCFLAASGAAHAG